VLVVCENVILEHYTLTTGWWITRFFSQFKNNFSYFKCLKHLMKKVFQLYI